MVYALLISVTLLICQLIFVVWNLFHWRKLAALPLMWRQGKTQQHSQEEVMKNEQIKNDQIAPQPFISILIPARNEERNIAECIDSVLLSVVHAQQWWGGRSSTREQDSTKEQCPIFEVLVLDDHSTDATAQLVAQRTAAAPLVKLFAGRDLPQGWMGKSWACHQLAGHASGRWLLFLDADARLERTALVELYESLVQRQTGMVTGFPRQVVGGVLEHLVVPLMTFTIAAHLPIRFVSQSVDARFAAAHGAFILIARSTYDQSGGHAAFSAHLVDDVMLARAVKRLGHQLFLLDVTNLVYMRMYQSSGEVWNGFKKNMFPGIGRNHLIALLIMCLYSLMYVLPAIFIGIAAFTDVYREMNLDALALSIGAYLLAVLIKCLIDWKNRLPVWLSLFMPISILFMLCIMVDSWRTALFGKTYEWKGRQYS